MRTILEKRVIFKQLFFKGNKLFRLMVTTFAAVLLLAACSSSSDEAKTVETNSQPKVLASFYPLQWLAEEVGQGVVNVQSLTPEGTEPHDLSLDAKAIENMRSSKAVFYLGDDFQPEVDKAVKNLPNGVIQTDLLKADGLQLLEVDEGEKDGHDHEAHAHDPHVWLDPIRMQAMAKTIAANLTQIAPQQTSVIDGNLQKVTEKLQLLDTDMKLQIKECKQNTIVTSHAAFAYFADRYGLKQLAIAGISPDEEPNAKAMQQIAATAKQQGVSTVFFEESLPAEMAETIAKEAGAQTDLLAALEFDPASVKGASNNADYLSVQRDNAQRIHRGLNCV